MDYKQKENRKVNGQTQRHTFIYRGPFSLAVNKKYVDV